MAMNYIGSISVLDRGDSPAQEVLDRNALSLAQRVADETKEELNLVLRRVETIYDNYEQQSAALEQARQDDVEYLNDIAELEELLRDEVKKRLYQQKVTIFIVGYEEVCGQRLRLMKQVSEFLTNTSANLEQPTHEDELSGVRSPETEADEIAQNVEEAIDTAELLSKRLGDLHKEVIDCVTNWANIRASNKGKKKLEKSLQQAKDEMFSLTEKLLNAQEELEARGEKVQQLYKQLEMKTAEVQKYKTAAEVAKRNMSDSDETLEKIADQEQQIKDLQNQLESGGGADASASNAEHLERIQALEDELQAARMNQDEVKKALQEEYENEIELQKREFDEKMTQIQEESNSQVQQMKSSDDEGDGDGRPRRKTDTSEKLDLEDEKAWLSVPKSQIPARFHEYRERTRAQLSDLRDQIAQVTSRVERKIATLKEQFNEHKTKWEQERLLLIEQLEQAQTLQEDAEQEAEQALTQLEQFVQDQETAEEKEAKQLEDIEKLAPLIKPPPPPKQMEERSVDTLELETQTDDEKAKELEKLQKLLDEKDQKLKTPVFDVENLTPDRLATLERIKTYLTSDEDDIARIKAYNLLRAAMLQALETRYGEGFVERSSELPVSDDEKQNSTLKSTVISSENITARELDARAVTLLSLASQFSETSLGVGIEPGSVLRSYTALDGERLSEIALKSSGEQGPVKLASEPPLPPPPRYLLGLQQQNEQQAELDQPPELFEAEVQTSPIPAPKTPSLPRPPSMLSNGVQYSPQPEKEATDLTNVTAESPQKSVLSKPGSAASSYKQELERLRSSAKSRRTKTPQSEAELKSLINEDEVDELPTLPTKEGIDIAVGRSRLSHHSVKSAQVGTSPAPDQLDAATAMTNRSESPAVVPAPVPVVTESDPKLTEAVLFLYTAVCAFKEQLVNVLSDSDVMSYSEVLHELEPISLSDDLSPQLDSLCISGKNMLDEIIRVLSTVIALRREPTVSSVGVSRQITYEQPATPPRQTRTPPQPPQTPTQGVRPESRYTSKSAGSGVIEDVALMELQDAFDNLKEQLSNQSKSQEDENNRSTGLMMEMQDTIQQLQRELSATKRERDEALDPPVSPAVMFSSTEHEHNTRALLKAYNNQRLDLNQYEDAVRAMDDYVQHPKKRLGKLAQKYVHYRQMKLIEESVRQSHCLSEEAFQVLDKMEALQNSRAERWSGEMDVISSERQRLAEQLDETLSAMEKDSGAFLIKPTYFRKPMPREARTSKALTASKRSKTRGSRRQTASHPKSDPAPTPASTKPATAVGRTRHTPTTEDNGGPEQYMLAAETDPEVSGAGLKRPSVLQSAERQTTFNLASTHVTDANQPASNAWITTPKILEIDVNRTMIRQNTISNGAVGKAKTSADLLDRNANLPTHSYVALNRNLSNLPNDATRSLDETRYVARRPTNSPQLPVLARPPSGLSGRSSRGSVGTQGSSTLPRVTNAPVV